MKHAKQNAETPEYITAEEWVAMSDAEKIDAVQDNQVDPVLMFETVGADAIKQLLNAPQINQTVEVILDGDLQAACFLKIVDHLKSLGVIRRSGKFDDNPTRHQVGLESGKGSNKRTGCKFWKQG